MKHVKGCIERKTMLYKTAVEFGDCSMNHALGCSHGCKYPCYAFLMKRRFGTVKTYEDWVCPYLVSNTLDLLKKEIPRFKGKVTSVHLCFTSDPFMHEYDEIGQMSLDAIKLLNGSGIKCTVLAKGILPPELAGLSKDNVYGISLVSLDEDYRALMEPGAAPYSDRLAALKQLHLLGCKTWVSMEPYPTPNLLEQDLHGILAAVSFTGKIIFGRANYSKTANAYPECRKYYNQLAKDVVGFCNSEGIQHHIKTGTATPDNPLESVLQ
jgi:DNA repair photolyase